MDKQILRERVRANLRRAARSIGIDVAEHNPGRALKLTRASLLDQHQVALALDVGANTGQYARQLRAWGYRGRIVSFEPLSHAFVELAAAARRDPAWECREVALGEAQGCAQLNIAGNSQSSSLLPMEPAHAEAAPESIYEGTEEVRVETLDTILPQLGLGAGACFIKCDVQGYELQVLAGGAQTLGAAVGVELEASLLQLYEEEGLVTEVNSWMRARGFRLIALEPAWTDPRTGELLQLNALFARQPLA